MSNSLDLFQQIGFVDYQFKPNVNRVITNITRNTKVQRTVERMPRSHFERFDVSRGERPDNLSFELYGTSRLWWTFFIINPALRKGIDEWPLSSQDLQNKIKKKNKKTKCLTGFRRDENVPKDLTNMAGSVFKIGETVEGVQTGATGVVVGKNIGMNQIFVKIVSGMFQNGEDIVGVETGTSLISNGDYGFSIQSAHLAPHRFDPQRLDFVEGDEVGLSSETYAELEMRLNEERKVIWVLRPDRTEDFVRQVREALRGL